MPSAGTPVLPVRLHNDVKSEIERAVRRRNFHSWEEKWTVSDFIRIAIREKLAKMERCRKQRKRRKRQLEVLPNLQL
jgi:Arc/MetJ-type ribon-helix-helix transcriptional regulator